MKRATPVALAAIALAAMLALDLQAADRPADRVVVIYFHRTERCPTCQKMGAYSEEAVKQKFAGQLKDGTIEFHFVDFQKKKNEKLVKGYKVGDPALIVAKIVENKVKEFKDLEEIWTKVQKKPEFLEYVQKNVASYRK